MSALGDSISSSDFIGLPLKVEGKDGSAVDELVAASRLAEDRYLVRFSPGLYKGIAAGDEIEYNPVTKSARVLARGGNIVIQVFHKEIPGVIIESLKERALGIGGWIDGEDKSLVVLTFPVGVGFPAIESLMATLPPRGIEWEYGNVYDEKGKPLGWWE